MAAPARASWPAVRREPRAHAARPPAAACASSSRPRVLFVCLGNICRSPSAEAVFRGLVERAGAAIDVDSCGTGGGSSDWYKPGGFSYHEGDDADSRMTAAASKRGYKLTSISRPLAPSDLTHFDLIVGMEAKNLAAVRRAADFWRETKPDIPSAEDVEGRLAIMTDFCTRTTPNPDKVPDPYYGGEAGFELVLDLLEDACEGLLGKVNK